MNFDFLRRKEWVWLVVLAVFFVILRLPAVHHPYHQDEYKWPMYANPAISAPGAVVHPPLAELVYRELGPAVGYDNFRFIPFAFGLINLFLIFYLSKLIFNSSKIAFWTAFLFAVSFYSILASLMVDVDGAVMPAFFLIMSIGYFQLRKTNFQFSPKRSKLATGQAIFNFQNWIWMILFIVGAVGGFLVKVSGILPLVAFALDFAIIRGFFADRKRFIKFIELGILLATAAIIVLLLAKLIFPFFPLEKSIDYWEHFWNSSGFLNRGWLQTFVQFAKSVLYTSPLLFLPVFFVDKDIWQKLRPFFFFIFIGLFFYLFAFDFSIGALDRYFQFLIIPLCIISGAVFAKLVGKKEKISKKEIISISAVSFLIFFIQFLNHFTPPLYPKTEWIGRIISLKWNFLFPFMGGSGPIPFYVSFGFMALIWVYSFALVIPSFIKNNFKRQALIGILVLGLLYNGVFAEEYLFGRINGSASKLVYNAVEFIKNNDDIKSIRVYNDNGGFNIMETGKYEKRLYLDPKFGLNQKVASLSAEKGYFLVVDIPHIDSSTVFAKYFASCETIYNQKSGKIETFIYDCKNAPEIKL